MESVTQQVPKLLQREEAGAVLVVPEDEARGGVDGHGARQRVRVRVVPCGRLGGAIGRLVRQVCTTHSVWWGRTDITCVDLERLEPVGGIGVCVPWVGCDGSILSISQARAGGGDRGSMTAAPIQ